MPQLHPALDDAHRTLLRGCEVLRAARPAEDPSPPEPLRRQRARFHGNGLRELDRFLSVLTEAAAVALAVDSHDAPAFARLDNAANKLDRVRGMMGDAPPRDRLLPAIGRLRACLHHCSGKVHDAALWDDLDLIDAMARDGDHAAAATLALSPATIARICDLYRTAADDLVDQVKRAAQG